MTNSTQPSPQLRPRKTILPPSWSCHQNWLLQHCPTLPLKSKPKEAPFLSPAQASHRQSPSNFPPFHIFLEVGVFREFVDKISEQFLMPTFCLDNECSAIILQNLPQSTQMLVELYPEAEKWGKLPEGGEHQRARQQEQLHQIVFWN